MAGTAGQGCDNGDASTTSTTYTYVARYALATQAGLVTQICIDIDTNSDTLYIGCAAISGTTITPRNSVQIDTSGDGTGVQTYNAPGDFTAFEIESGDCIIFLSASGYGAYGRSSSGGTNQYGYVSGDSMTSQFTMSTATSRYLEVAFVISDATTYEIVGVTKDNDGDALGSCECFLFKDNQDDTLTFMDHTTSHVTTGAYTFSDVGDNDSQYIVYSFKDDTPHVFDVTDHVLQPTEV